MTIENEFRFDVRIQKRMVNKGLVQKEELEQRLSGLKDLEEECETLEVEQPGHTQSEAEPEVSTPEVAPIL